MANPATTAARATQDERIPGLPMLPPGTDPATLTVPVYSPATDRTHQAPIGGPAAVTNAIIGGPKLVQYRDSRLFGVPVKALTLDRLNPLTIVPGVGATVQNPADMPLVVTKPPQQYVATAVAAGTAGAVLVPRYIGAAAGDMVPIVWKQVLVSTGAGAPAISALFLSDTTGILSPEGQARLDASALYWLVPATTQTPPVVVVPPAPTQRMLVQLADKGVKNDGVITNKKFSGGTDNGPALVLVKNANTSGAFHDQQPIELLMPAGGIVGAANNKDSKPFYRYRDAKLNLNGTTLISIYVPDNPNSPDNFFSAFAYRPEMLQSNAASYSGGKAYYNLARIATVQAGSKTIQVLDLDRIADRTIYFVGARITIMSKEVVLGESAYPPGTKHNERPLIIVAIDYATGAIELDRELEYEHRADWPENPQTSGGGAGQGRIVPLDAPGAEYPEYFEVAGGGGTLQSSDASSPGSFGWICNVLVVQDVTLTNGATITETLTSATWTNVVVLLAIIAGKIKGAEVELDKGDGNILWINVTVGFTSNGGGVRSFKMVGGLSTDSLQLSAPIVELEGVECWASAFKTDNYTVNHPVDPAVGSYTGFHNTSLYRVKNLKLGADNQATAYLSPLELRTITVTSVDGQRAGFYWNGTKQSPANLVWRGAQPGTRFYTLNGTQVGRQVGQVGFTADVPARTSGTFWVTMNGFTPAIGDTYEFSNVLAIVDDGGHTILTPNHPARLFSEETVIWKNNQRTDGVPGAVTITKADLLFRGGGTGAYVVLRGKPSNITLTLPTAAPGARLLVVGENKARQSQSDVELVRFGLGTTGTRYAGTAGASEGMSATNEPQTIANQYRPAAFGAWAYTLVIYFDGTDLAHIPDDFSLTLETDFS